jgi:transcription initiation factor TFIIIB Brf1 subunit/transcription initiation factor TFIIB
MESNFNRDNEEKIKCCSKPEIEKVHGELVCRNCGMVHGKDLGEERSPALKKGGWRTRISLSRRDGQGKMLNKSDIHRVRKLQSTQKSLQENFDEKFEDIALLLKRLSSQLSLPEYIKERAKRICESFIQLINNTNELQNVINSPPSKYLLTAACLYAAVRADDEVTRFINDFAEPMGVPNKVLKRFSKKVIVNKVFPALDVNLKFQPRKPEQYVGLISSRLPTEVPQGIQMRAMKILRKMSEKSSKLTRKYPKTLATATLYLLLGKKISIESFIEITHLPETTLKKIIQRMEKILDL